MDRKRRRELERALRKKERRLKKVAVLLAELDREHLQLLEEIKAIYWELHADEMTWETQEAAEAV